MVDDVKVRDHRLVQISALSTYPLLPMLMPLPTPSAELRVEASCWDPLRTGDSNPGAQRLAYVHIITVVAADVLVCVYICTSNINFNMLGLQFYARHKQQSICVILPIFEAL